ncbi:MAG TPA: LssY C-terminal domain-containing protein, partial [Bradyrhizobium sp.]|nr:LssY C-terminal domain-containing protein [Bradyrhizobium sp.]
MTDIDRAQSQALPHHSRLQRALLLALSVVAAYALLAYVALPALWTHYEHQKGLAELPMLTRTAQGIPGDPINIGLVGDNKDVLCA